MINRVMDVLTQHKTYVVVALAVLSILAYAVPYGMDAEAKHGGVHTNPPGNSQGYGYGLACEHFTGPGPIRCR